MAALSGLSFPDILSFVLKSYDFDGQKKLSIDEVSLALKSLSIGLCKCYLLPLPDDQSVETLTATVRLETIRIHTDLIFLIIILFFFVF